ncbi:MAG: ACT domain-containing protein [Floccifex porci]|uniref:ACT domain-containing protein n=1 Tax=Floccifex porci TaxID=2606629 RepID=UPI00270A8EBD|nr:ACT domain-containing protein [Erysipelotrichaceae bacterium]MDO4480579.1 ACT domain-containing protein [Erysipelotrichaceae bacterium]
MKAIITVIGKDKVGILAMIANECMKGNINILDVSQTIVDGFFTMTMSTDFTNASETISQFATHMEEFGKEKELVIRVMHQDIFDSMHKI